MDDKNLGQLFLSGGGDETQSEDLDKLFVKEIEKKGGKILYIPIALTRDFIGYEAAYDWLINTLNRYTRTFLEIDMWSSEEFPFPSLDNYSGVYIGGGNTFKLLEILVRRKIDYKIKSFYYHKGIIYGGSAGAIILGKDINTVVEEQLEYQSIYSVGLSLLENYSIRCHFKKDRDEKKVIDYISNFKNPVIAMEENVGLVVKEIKAQVVGKGCVYIYDTKGRRNSFFNNQIINLKQIKCGKKRN